MKRFIYLILCLLMPVVGAWGATVTDLSDWNGNTYGKLTVDGTSAVIEFYDNTTVNTNFNTEPITQVMKDLTEVKVKGTIPNSVKDFFNVNQHGHGFSKCQRMDFSEATENIPTDISQHENVTSVILPEGSSLNSITLPNPKPHQSDLYVIVANDGDSEHPVDVLVKKGTAWASDPLIEDASYINVYDTDGTTYLESDEVTALQQTKIVNGEGTIVTVEDLTINANTEDEAAVLDNFLNVEKKMIKNLTVTGELEDLTLFDGVEVKKDVDFSGITNSDLSTLKLPDTSGTISLPGGSYKNGVITLADGYTNAQLSNILAALSNSGKSVSEIVFPGGSTFNTSTKALEVTTADEDSNKLGSIADAIRGAGYTIESVKLEKYGTSWSNNKMTASSSLTDEEVASQKALLESAGFTVNSTKVTNYPDIEITKNGNTVTITSYRAGALDDLFKNEHNNDPEAQAYKQLLQENSQGAEGSTLVLVGPFKKPDLDKLKNNNYNKFETVDMSNATFDNANEAVFTYFDANTLKKAYMSNDPKVTTITEQCFQNMNKLEELHIGGSVTSIPAQRIPTSIKKVYSSNSVTEIEDAAFLNYTNLELFDFGSDPHVTRIGEDAFNKTALSGDLIIPNSVERIELRAFKAVSGISSITIQEGSNLEYIGSEAFRMDDNFNLKNVYVYAEKEIECDENAWDFYATDGQTQMATVRTRLHYPPSMYYWYVGDWKSQVNGGRIEGHDDLLNLRNAVDDADGDGYFNGVEITPKTKIGWQKFISSGIPVTFDMDWRTYSDIVDLKVPEYDSRVADVYIVCGYQDGKAVLKQMKENDIIPAGTGLVIHHYVTNQQNGGVLFFPHVTPQEASQAISEDPNALKPYRFVSEGDKRGVAGQEEWNTDDWAFAQGMNYVGIETRDYVSDGQSYHNYLEAIHCMGVERAIYNAENGNYINYNTLEMKAYKGQKVTYRNFFFGNGKKLQASMTAGSIGSGKDWNAESDGEMEWGFFRCVTDMYAVNSKAFLHYPANVFTQSHTTSPGTITEGVVSNAKSMGLFIIDEINVSGITTGIKTVNDKDDSMDDSYYTLQGVRVSTPAQNGIYIHKGKKIVVK